MSLKKIKAKDGCVVFFPSRAESSKLPRVISGPKQTRKKWGEEWVQVSIDLVTVEIRLEGDKAVNLGNQLRCDVVARLMAQIDDRNLNESLPKMVDKMRCSTTSHPEEVLRESFFRDRLSPMFLGAVRHVVAQAEYLRLLDAAKHHGELQAALASEVKQFLDDCGFIMLSSEIRFRPLDPGILGAEQAITEKWIEQEACRVRLEAKKERVIKQIEEDNKREDAKKSAETEEQLKEIELEKQKVLISYEKQDYQVEEKERQRKRTRRRNWRKLGKSLIRIFPKGKKRKRSMNTRGKFKR